jgi:hypothetical protein
MPVAKKGAAAPKKPAVSVANHMRALNSMKKLMAGATASFTAEALEEALLPKNLLKQTSSNAYFSVNTEEGSQIKIWASTFDRCFEWDEEQELFTLIQGARIGKSGDVYPPSED